MVTGTDLHSNLRSGWKIGVKIISAHALRIIPKTGMSVQQCHLQSVTIGGI